MRSLPFLLLASLPFLTGIAPMEDEGRTQIQSLESKTEVILAVQREAAMRDESLAAEERKATQEILISQKEILQKMDDFLKMPPPVLETPDWSQDFSSLKSGLLVTMIATGSGLLLFLILYSSIRSAQRRTTEKIEALERRLARALARPKEKKPVEQPRATTRPQLKVRSLMEP